MVLEIRGSARKLSLEEINTFIKKLGTPPLPDDYMEFLIQHNGGVPSPNTYFIQNHPEKFCDIHSFFGIEVQIEARCLDWIFYECQDYIPRNLFPIGNSSTNDLICLSLSGETRGGVFFLDCMAETNDNVYKIANSFTEFLEGLYEFQDPDEIN